VCGLAGLLLFALPLPYASIDEGVVWVPEEAALRAGADGVVARLLAAPGATVAAGQPLIAQEDPVAAAAVAVDRAQAVVLRGRYVAVNLIDRVQALLVHEELDRAEARLARAEQRQRDLVLVARRPGRFVVPEADHLIGAWRHQGEVLGYVIGSDDAAVRVVVPQAEIDLVRRRTRGVAIRTADRPEVVQPARIVRQTPSALERVPAPALTPQGGGPMLLDPASPKNERPLERFYEVELRPTEPTPAERIGSHAYARFDYGAEPVAWRLLRGLRQLFLRTLDA
jgi:putative peptide zinc metalloprotease protein